MTGNRRDPNPDMDGVLAVQVGGQGSRKKEFPNSLFRLLLLE